MIGDKVWFKGDEFTITSNPYQLYGKMFHDGIDANGKTRAMLTPDQVKENDAETKRVWREQQAGFRRVREAT